MTIVDLNNLGYRDEPFVLAQDVAQVFYIKDMTSKPKKGINKQNDEPKRHIVLSGKRNIVGVEDKTDLSEEYRVKYTSGPQTCPYVPLRSTNS